MVSLTANPQIGMRLNWKQWNTEKWAGPTELNGSFTGAVLELAAKHVQ